MSRGLFAALDAVGLNLQAVFNLDDLPADIVGRLRGLDAPASRYRQLILVGHAGKALWEAVQASGRVSADPIDAFSVQQVAQWLDANLAGCACEIIYPGNTPVGLQTLGRIAGWHHPSPFMVGINEAWGSWYAYRVVVLAASDLPPSTPLPSRSPCDSCLARPCVSSCPAGALASGVFALDRCLAYRQTAASSCAATCLARVSCPVGAAHRYDDAQLAHTYSISLRTVKAALCSR